MQHPGQVVARFICYVGCLAISTLFAMNYKTDIRAIPLSISFLFLGLAINFKHWEITDADAEKQND